MNSILENLQEKERKKGRQEEKMNSILENLQEKERKKERKRKCTLY